jgi:type IV pilus assembly protein PilW
MRRINRTAGFTLVELMVSMTIGLFILGALITVFLNVSRSYDELAMTAEQTENGRYASEILQEDLQHAGFYGYFANPGPAPGTLPDPCETDPAELRPHLAVPIQGYDGGVSPLPSCLAPANHVAGTDILVIRRASTATTPLAALQANEVYIQSNGNPTDPANPVVSTGGDPAAYNLTVRPGTTIAPVRKYAVHMYFVSPCSVPSGSGGAACASGDDTIPTLKRLELGVDGTGTRTMRVVPLVEGIENFQVDYGIDTSDDGAPNGAFVSLPATPAEWQNVMAVRVHLLARNTRPSPGYTDDKSYNLGTAGTVTPGGSFRRHVFTTTIRLNNPSGRRETP